jgi:diguanylate cyclase (GGDEF)-like protein/PAS domain S-box-containing protein
MRGAIAQAQAGKRRSCTVVNGTRSVRDDVTGGARAHALADLLRQATQASLDPDAVLEVVVRWCVHVLGDLASVRVLARDGSILEPGPVVHRDPAAERLAVAASAPQRMVPPAAPRGSLTDAVLTSHQPLFRPRGIPVEAAPPGWEDYAEQVGLGSAILAPLRSRGRVLGVLSVVRDRGSDPYTRDDLDLVVEVAARIGLVFDNARLYERVRVQAATLEHVDAAVCAVDAEGRITAFNPAAQRMFGWPEAEVLGRRPTECLSDETPDRTAQARAAVVRDGRFAGEWRLRRRDGEAFQGHIHSVVVLDDRGQPNGMVAVYQDLTERLRLIAQLERRAAQQAAVAALGERALEAEEPAKLLSGAVGAVCRTLNVELAALFALEGDGRALVLRAGAGFAGDVAGRESVPAGWHESQEGFTLIRREPVIVDDVEGEQRFGHAELVAQHGAVSAVTVVVQGRGGPHGVLGAYSSRPGAFAPDDVSFLQSVANVLGDALDRFLSDAEIRRRGLHDPLTELPNRALVMDRLVQASQRLDRTDARVALVFIDLDHFKHVNDSLGHRAGDAVLRQVADRLRAAVRPGDTVGRFGGDEFVVVCEDIADEGMALTVAERLSQAFAAPFRAGGDEHVLGASVGIALLDAEQDVEELLRDADAAMYRAKERGRSRIELFDTGMRAWAEGRLQTEGGLRRALELDEIEVHYQPIVDLSSGTIAAVEALVRWRHPERGLLAPGTFVPVAEESGLIVPLGRRVLELACEQAAAWSAVGPGGGPLPVHVNLSPRQLHDHGLVETVHATLEATGAQPAALALEITESTLIDRGPARLRLLERLRELGTELVLDDFGTGWSSLSYLAQLPISGLKIDRSFVAGLAGGQAPIVDAVVRLARAFDLSVVAEGIEDRAQLHALRRLGCEHGQGYLFARPMPAEELAPLLFAPSPPAAWREAAA